jgi:hypothetical protein
MDPQLPPDFSEFLALLNSESVEYLVVGGYAVGHHGYPRCVQATWSGVQVPLIARDDLIKNKRAAGRHKDLNDVERLTEQGEAGQ